MVLKFKLPRNRTVRAARILCLGVVAACWCAITAATAHAQRAEASLASPMNVAHVSIRLLPGEAAPRLVEENGRALYVATSSRRRGLLRDRGGEANFWFLFHGDQPLKLTWPNGRPPMVIQPRGTRDRPNGRLVADWWDAFVDQAEQRMKQGHQPPVADEFLLAMLAARMKQPLESKRKEKQVEDRPLETIELLAGAERLRSDVLRKAFVEPAAVPFEMAPLPRPALWETLPPQPVAENVVVEPLAKLTPPECMYVRFDKFSSFLWMTHLIREQGGDLGSMISSRGFGRDLTARFERQFAIRYSILADLLGDQVVGDLALVGTDVYLADGAAMGVLLQAKNTLLLDAALQRERSSSLAREKANGCQETTVKINGHDTSLLVTPDNGVRSFYLAHKEFRFVTNSRYLAERFWALVDGAESLGALNEFQHARTRMPAGDNDTLFAYFSTEFFHNLVSPTYQIELRRRFRAIADFQIYELAVIAARREGWPLDEQSLVRNGLLPADWGQRPDGSRLLRTQKGVLVDSVRGGRGTMLPIPDMVLRDVTTEERDEFLETAEYYQEKWRTMDPVMASVKRFSVDGRPKVERLVVDAQVSPFVERKYSRWLGLLGEPTTEQIAAPKDAVVIGQASLRGGLVRPSVPAHQLFIGVVDQVPAVPDLKLDGIIDALRTVQAIPGYLGAWPRPGFLDVLPFSTVNQEDAEGYSRLPFRLWRWRMDGYSVLSFDRSLLQRVTPQLTSKELESPTQAWLRVTDISQSKLAPWIRELNYQQAVAMSRGNAAFLTTLTETLASSPEQAEALAGRLVDGEIQCPLDGKYTVDPQRPTAWVASEFAETAPEDYVSPLLDWFRGGAVMLNSGGGRLMAHCEIDIERDKAPTTLPSPADLGLPLLKGLPSLFGIDRAKSAAKPKSSKSE